MDDQQDTEFRAVERTEPAYVAESRPVEGMLLGETPALRSDTPEPGTFAATRSDTPEPGTFPAQEVMREPVSMAVPAQESFPAQEMTREPMSMAVPAQEMTREMPMEGFTPRIGEAVQPAMTAEMPMEGFTPRIGTAVQPDAPFMQAKVGTAMPAEQGVLAQEDGTTPAHLMSEVPKESGVPAQLDGTTAALKVGGAPLSVAKVPTAMMTPAQQSASPSSGSGSGSGGGAGQGFQVSPEQYQAAVSPMLAASEQVMALFTTLNSYLPSMESQQPWGKDESGKKFAEGEKGYLKYSADTLKTLKGLPDGLKYIADGLKAMAQGYEGADSGVTSDLTGQDNQLSASPPPTWSPSVHTPITPMNTYEHVNQSGRH